MNYILVGLLIVNLALWLFLIFTTWRKKNTGYSGTIIVTQKAEGVKLYSLEGIDPDDLESKDEVVFKIERSENT